MGWFKNLLGIVGGEAPKEYIFIPHVGQGSPAPSPVEANETYVELFVDSLRIDKARSFATRFHGVVYTFASLAKQGSDTADFASVTKPDKLAELDKDSVGRILTISRKMMGPVPWRGGSFDLQLGLFSIKSGNVLTPLLSFVTKVSDAAGMSFLGAVKPFVPLISEGMDLIAGQTQDTKLVVGVDTSIQLVQTGTCAIIAKPKGSINAADLSLDAADGKLLLHGSPLDAAYCVFSIRATDRKPDFGEIPELKESFAQFRQAVIEGEEAEAREAFAAFRRQAITSPDLIQKDAMRLIEMTKTMLDSAFPSDAPVPAAVGDGPLVITRGEGGGAMAALVMPDDLASMQLY